MAFAYVVVYCSVCTGNVWDVFRRSEFVGGWGASRTNNWGGNQENETVWIQTLEKGNKR